MEGLNDASQIKELAIHRAALGHPMMIPAEVNCALCACAALCSHVFKKKYTSGRVLRVMWEKIIAKHQGRKLSLSAKEQAIQQHQFSFKYFLDEIDRDLGDKEPKRKPWILMEDPYAWTTIINDINNSQWRGMAKFISEELKQKEKTHEVKRFRGSLKDAIQLMIGKKTDWVFALLVSGQASFTAEAGSEGIVFGHWNFAYLTPTDKGLKAHFIDYQGRKAVRSTWPVCAAAGNLLAEPGSQETLLIAVDSNPWRELIPTSIIRPTIKVPEPKQKNSLRPHTNAATRSAIKPAVNAAVSHAPPTSTNNRRPPTPGRTTRPRNTSRKRSRSKKK